MNTQLTNELLSASKDAQYDRYCKNLLTHKIILAHIMKECVREFKNYDADFIAKNCILDTPEVSEVAVHRNTENTPKIIGANNEDTTMNEGTVYFDIRFVAVLPDTNENIKLIINLEAQNNYNLGYSLIRRALYYCCRLISSQYGTEFSNSDYNNIKKVYSIWICTNTPDYAENTITEFSIGINNVLGNLKAKKSEYDIMEVVMLCLDKNTENIDECENNILKLLKVLLSDRIATNKKTIILNDDFDIEPTVKIKKELNDMCNLSAGVRAEGREEGRLEGRAEGNFEGMIRVYREFGTSFSETVDKISSKFNMSKSDAENIVKEYWE